MANKFINTNFDDNQEVNNNNNSQDRSEYSDQIQVKPSKAQNEYIDISNKGVKLFFILLGLFCIFGVAYYVVEWLGTK